MCTAVTYQSKDYYFGRNLDYECDFGEVITITPRNYDFHFRHLAPMAHHYAMIGMAVVASDYPLYFDGTNEHGLSIAGLNFPYSAKYQPASPQKDNLASFEIIPWLLGSCQTVDEAVVKLKNVNITNVAFSPEFSPASLHWILADSIRNVVIEQTEDGLHVYDNPFGVLTNEPPFPYHRTNLCNYVNVTAGEITNRFTSKLSLQPYSRGMGGIGLPGDLSSPSRFIRAAFTKLNSVSKDSESASISQVFHILESVAQQQGCVKIGHLYEKTIYSSCCNTTKGIYYYTTYENSQITGICLHGVDLDDRKLFTYPLVKDQQIRMIN